MRAPGHPQGNWALEQALDALAEKLKMDPVDLRLKNLTTVSQARDNIPYTSTGFKECLEEGAKAFGWAEARNKKPGKGPIVRGVGMAGCTWAAGGGGPPSTAIVRYFADGSVNLNMGASDIGCGTKTVMAMIVVRRARCRRRKASKSSMPTRLRPNSPPPAAGARPFPPNRRPLGPQPSTVATRSCRWRPNNWKCDASDLRMEKDEIVSSSSPDKKVKVGRNAGVPAEHASSSASAIADRIPRAKPSNPSRLSSAKWKSTSGPVKSRCSASWERTTAAVS